jgi:hypothetical protein
MLLLMVTPGAPGVTSAVSGSRARRVKPWRFTGRSPRLRTPKNSIPPPPSVGHDLLQVYRHIASVILDLDCGKVEQSLAEDRIGHVTLEQVSDRVLVAARGHHRDERRDPDPQLRGERAVLAGLEFSFCIHGPRVGDLVAKELDGRILGTQSINSLAYLPVHRDSCRVREGVLVQLVELDYDPGPPPVRFLEVGRNRLLGVEREWYVPRGLGLPGTDRHPSFYDASGFGCGGRRGFLGAGDRGLLLVAARGDETIQQRTRIKSSPNLAGNPPSPFPRIDLSPSALRSPARP